MPSVSPTTRAGTSAAGSAGRPATAARSPARTRVTAASTGPGGATSVGDARARAQALTGSSAAGRASRTTAATVAPAGTLDHARTSSPDAVSRTVAPDVQDVTAALDAGRGRRRRSRADRHDRRR